MKTFGVSFDADIPCGYKLTARINQSCTRFYHAYTNALPIPRFPTFKPLTLTDREEVERITNRFVPYSDFTFTSMYAWDVNQEIRLSRCQENLIVRFTDYVTRQPFYSLIGTDALNEVTHNLLVRSAHEGLGGELRLVPHDVVKALDGSRFEWDEDRDNHDYVYSLTALSEFGGSKFQADRGHLARLLKNNNIRVVTIERSGAVNQTEIEGLYERWSNGKKIEDYETSNEYKALARLMANGEHFKHTLQLAYDDDKLISLLSFELLPGNWAVAHFHKSDLTYRGLAPLVMKEHARYCFNHGKSFINWEQDLGLQGLRNSKTKYQPIELQKKYKVRLRY